MARDDDSPGVNPNDPFASERAPSSSGGSFTPAKPTGASEDTSGPEHKTDEPQVQPSSISPSESAMEAHKGDDLAEAEKQLEDRSLYTQQKLDLAYARSFVQNVISQSDYQVTDTKEESGTWSVGFAAKDDKDKNQIGRVFIDPALEGAPRHAAETVLRARTMESLRAGGEDHQRRKAAEKQNQPGNQ